MEGDGVKTKQSFAFFPFFFFKSDYLPCISNRIKGGLEI